MRLEELSIKNFRGIRQCLVRLNNDSAISCLIGPGDSGKSTILTAIEWVFWPRYALGIGDIDFYNCDTTNQIEIEATISGYPDELISESKFAHYQRRLPATGVDYAASDDPGDDEETALTIRLQVDESLEPEWYVVKNSQEPRRIGASDRAKIPVCVIGSRHANDMIWGRQSLLQRYAASNEAVKATSISAARELSHMELADLDEVTRSLPEKIAQFGVSVVEANLANRFIMAGTSLPSQVGLFEGNAPLMYLGEGSRRLFSAGLAFNLAANGALILVDEIESGLEPHRLCNLIAKLRRNTGEEGSSPRSQSIFTTHSPIVLQELVHDEIYAVTKRDEGCTSVCHMSTADAKLNNEIQAQLRATPSAFLARRIYVCEGKTELGIMRAVDEHRRERNGVGLTAEGVAFADAQGGTKMFIYARHLKEAGYQPCIFMDSDVGYQSEKDDAKKLGIDVFDWDEGNMTEVQVFADVPGCAIGELLKLAADFKDEQSVRDKLRNRGLDFDQLLTSVTVSSEDRDALGHLAGDGKWFKRVDSGMALGKVVVSHKSDLAEESTLYQTLRKLEEWAIG